MNAREKWSERMASTSSPSPGAAPKVGAGMVRPDRRALARRTRRRFPPSGSLDS